MAEVAARLLELAVALGEAEAHGAVVHGGLTVRPGATAALLVVEVVRRRARAVQCHGRRADRGKFARQVFHLLCVQVWIKRFQAASPFLWRWLKKHCLRQTTGDDVALRASRHSGNPSSWLKQAMVPSRFVR